MRSPRSVAALVALVASVAWAAPGRDAPTRGGFPVAVVALAAQAGEHADSTAPTLATAPPSASAGAEGASVTGASPGSAPSAVGTLDDVGRARLSLIQRVETEEAPRVSLWRWIWAGLYTAATVGQLVPIPFFANDRGLQTDFVVGAISSAFGAALLIFVPNAVIADAPKVKALPADRDGLTEAERLLRVDADDEDFSVSWLMHAGNVVFNAAFGLVLGLGFKRWESAAWNFGIGLVVGEVMLFTQPTGLRQHVAPAAPKVTLLPLVAPGLGGVAVGGTF